MSKLLFMLFGCLFSSVFAVEIEERPIVVVIPSYNNQKWAPMNLSSVLDQEYKNFRIIYINDCSRDETAFSVRQTVEDWICMGLFAQEIPYFCEISFDDTGLDIHQATEAFKEAVSQEKAFITLVNNVNRCGALCNLYRGIQSCEDHEIVVTVDGDDWLFHTLVLQELNDVYTNKDVWLTHGSLIEFPKGSANWCEPIPLQVIADNAFRDFKCPSHLRTFYAGLFKRIKLEDLLYKGKFFLMTWDMAMMYPMIEMAGERHEFIRVPNYVYNMSNVINDNKVDPELQNMLDRLLRQGERYERLEDISGIFKSNIEE